MESVEVFDRSLLLKLSAILRAIILITAFELLFLIYFKMKRRGLKTFGVLLRFLLLFKLYYHVQFTLVGGTENRIESNLNVEWPSIVENMMDLNERMKKIENQDRHQEQEIYFLKTNAIEDRKEINQLKLRVAQLEESSTVSVASSLVRTKRLYRLLPITNE